MKMISRLSILCVLTALFVNSVCFINLSAEDSEMTDQEIELIRNNCTLTKTTLNQLHSSDALLRVNSGQIYESIATKLMKRFNDRLDNNHYGNANFVSVTDSYESTLDKFRSDYIAYEEQLYRAINTDCQKQPVTFYDTISLARSKRAMVYGDVVSLNQYIDQYRTTVEQFKADYQAAIDGVNQ